MFKLFKNINIQISSFIPLTYANNAMRDLFKSSGFNSNFEADPLFFLHPNLTI